MIERLVVWGGVHDGNSLSWIWRAFHDNARKLGVASVWVEDESESYRPQAGDTVLAANVWDRHIGEAVPGVDYVLHNVSAERPLRQTVEPEHLLGLQVWTDDARGEDWGPFRRYDRRSRTLYQPWGTDLLAEEFMEPVYNPRSREAVFVGSVWSEHYEGVEQGNRGVIRELEAVLARHGLTLTPAIAPAGVPRMQLSNDENVEAVRAARLAPAFAGDWQVSKNLIPCRALKNVSYGALGLTNIPAFQQLYGGWCPTLGTVAEMVESALALKRSEYLGVVREQQRIVGHFTYRESIEAIGRAFEEGR